MIANYKASKTDSFPWIITEMFYETPYENSRLNPNIDTDLGWLGYQSQMKETHNWWPHHLKLLTLFWLEYFLFSKKQVWVMIIDQIKAKSV